MQHRKSQLTTAKRGKRFIYAALKCDPAHAQADVSAMVSLMTGKQGAAIKMWSVSREHTPRKSKAASAFRLGTPLNLMVAARLAAC